MACEQEQSELDTAISEVDQIAREQATALAARAEAETRKVGSDLEDDDDVATAIGAAAGGAVGGAFGGAPGAVAGSIIGREIGKLFIIDIEMKPVRFSIDLPEFSMERQQIGFDVPAVTLRNRDIIFHTPSIRMRRVKTGEKPETTCTGGRVWPPRAPSCTVTWTPIYIEIPEPFMQEQRIVLGVPEVSMNRLDMSFDKPVTRMTTQEVSFNAPSITVRTKFSEADRVAAEAHDLTKKFSGEAAVIATHVKEQSKEKIVPKISALFACHRRSIEQQISSAPQQFDPAIASASTTLAEMRSTGVPTSDDDYLSLESTHRDLLQQRQAVVDQLQKVLEDLNTAEREAVAKMLAS